MFSQASEPSSFDWSESFVRNVKTQALYNSSILQNLTKSSMFFVESRPREEERTTTFFVKDEHNIYTRFKKTRYIVNGKPVKYGLADMISANGKSYYSLMTDPNAYLENINVNEYSSGFYVGDLEDTSLDISEFKRKVESSNLTSHVFDDRTWYREPNGEFDISFENNNTVLKRNLVDNSLLIEEYAIVYENIYRIVKSIEYLPMVSAEGYCYEQKTTTTNSNYEFVDNRDVVNVREFSEELNNQSIAASNFKQNGDFISIENADKFIGGDIFILDVLGRVMYEGRVNSDRINFTPSTQGVYILSIKKDGELFSTKLYLN